MTITTNKTIKVGKFVITLSRWPNQGYGWQPHKSGKGPKAMLNPMGSRFGAGWNYKLGIDIGGGTVLLNLLFGIVTIRKERRA